MATPPPKTAPVRATPLVVPRIRLDSVTENSRAKIRTIRIFVMYTVSIYIMIITKIEDDLHAL